MTRKNFIKICSGSCLSIAGLGLIMQACKPAMQVQGTVSNNRLQLKKDEFAYMKKDKIAYRRSIVTKADNYNHPIVVYRFSGTEYSAILLSCTHQANELSVNGDILTCPAHGSEFSNKGEVLQGPAENQLKTFNVTSDEKNIYIQLA